jgi:hypothetical protein
MKLLNQLIKQYFMLDLRFSELWLWRLAYSGIQCRVIRWNSTNISKKHVVSIFRIEEAAKHGTSLKKGIKKATILSRKADFCRVWCSHSGSNENLYLLRYTPCSTMNVNRRFGERHFYNIIAATIS